MTRPRFTIRRLMIAVGVAAFASAVGVPFREQCLRTRRPGEITLASALAGAFGVASVRHPWLSLVALILVVTFSPSVDHPSSWSHLAPAIAASAWLIGASAGGIARVMRAPARTSLPDLGLPDRVELPEGMDVSPETPALRPEGEAR